MGLYIQEIKGHLGQVEWACEVEGGVQQVGLDGKRRGPTKIGVGLSRSREETAVRGGGDGKPGRKMAARPVGGGGGGGGGLAEKVGE